MASKPVVRRKKPAPKTVEVTVSLRLKEEEIRTRLAETVIDELYNSFRGYGAKPKVKLTVAGKGVV